MADDTLTSRRDVFRGLGMLALLPALEALSPADLAAQTSPQTQAQAAPAKPFPTKPYEAKNCVEPELTECRAFPFESLPVRYSEGGAPTRQILEGRVPGHEVIEIHETTLAPGKMPHPAHQHPHAELLLVRQGTIEFLSDAPPVRVTAGGAAYCAPGKLHGFHNVGEIDAVYFVVKIGSQPVCQK